MAIKMTGHTYCKCVEDYVREYVCDTEADVANLPECCTKSTALVVASGATYMVNASGEWVKFGGGGASKTESVEIWVKKEGEQPITFTEMLASDGSTHTVELVDTLPESLTLWDFDTGVFPVYVVKSTGIVYCNFGEGATTLGLALLQADGLDKGWTTDINAETEVGVYCVRTTA